MAYFGYSIADFVPCEICEGKAVDIHHIEARGMGGTKKPDVIENLMALCRHCHVTYGDVPNCMDKLREIHKTRMINK